MRLRATKTSLYKLVAEYERLPLMIKTEFRKSFRSPDYSMDWCIDGLFYHAFLAACIGKPLLSIAVRDYDREIKRDVYTLTIQDLRGRGMIDEGGGNK